MNPFGETAGGTVRRHGDGQAVRRLDEADVRRRLPDRPRPEEPGLCASVPFLEATVDFDALRASPTGFYVNAYNITRRKMQSFAKQDITRITAARRWPTLPLPAAPRVRPGKQGGMPLLRGRGARLPELQGVGRQRTGGIAHRGVRRPRRRRTDARTA